MMQGIAILTDGRDRVKLIAKFSFVLLTLGA